MIRQRIKFYTCMFVIMTYMLMGCSTIKDVGVGASIQYGTARVIEDKSNDINAVDVQEFANDLKEIVSEDDYVITLELKKKVKEMMNYDQMLPSDQMIVDSIMTSIQAEVQYNIVNEGKMEEAVIRLNRFVSMLETTAARY